jgi:hypothetical protein
MSNRYPTERYARLRLAGREFAWRTGSVTPHKAPLEKADPIEAYAPFLFDSLEAARTAHAEDMVKLWELVADGELTTEEAYAIDETMSIFKCTIEEDGRIHALDPASRLPTIAAQRAAGQDFRFGPAGEFEIGRDEAFAAFEVPDPLAASPAP